MIVEYSTRIEDRSFAHLFEKLEPSSVWSEPALEAWVVIDEKHLLLAESDAHSIAQAWVHSYVRKWNKECDAEARRQNMKGEAGDLFCVLLLSKSTLGEFAEASFRSKSRGYCVLA